MTKLWHWTMILPLAAVAVALAQTQPVDTGSGPLAPPQVLMLQASRPKKATGYGKGILIREIVRQAILIAARDELGLSTRDQAPREPFLESTPGQPAPVGVETGQLWENCRVSLTRTRNGRLARLRLADMPLMLPDERVHWLALLTAAEKQSRDLMVRRLRQIGFQGRTRPWGQGQAPAEVETLLSQMDFVSQFLAVRRLHAELARQGDSEALLGPLVRGYAHLGFMTDYFWNATHKVYKARALLYAQRMVAHDPQSPNALRHRAYAFALSGLPGLAEKDLSAADALPAAGAPASVPPWVALTAAYCRYDWQKLRANDWPKQVRPLAALLALLNVETHAGDRMTQQAADFAIQHAPRCLRPYDVLCARAGVSAGHRATVDGPEALADLLADELPKLEDLPHDVRAVLPENRGGYRRAVSRHAIAMALVNTPDRSAQVAEPSWAALGRIIEEAHFVQLERRLYFLAYMLSVDHDQLVAFSRQVLPSAQGHPLANVLESYQYLSGDDAAKLAGLFDALKALDAGFGLQPALRQARHSGAHRRENIEELRQAMYDQKDQISSEVSLLLDEWTDPHWKLWYARVLADIDPRSPHAAATFIEYEWEKTQDRLPQWEKDYAWQPAVIRALVPRLRQAHRHSQAVELCERYIAVAPAQWPFDQLAEMYLQQGQEDKWLATRERQLRVQDYGLDHARVRVQIARHFMDQQDFQRALPYAEAAAESWASWAMWSAAICNEGVGDWDRAELWVRRIAQRYEGERLDWARWVLRTGWGDAEQALPPLAALVKKLHQPGAREAILTNFAELLGWHDMLEGRPDEAIEHFRRSFREADQFWPGVVAMLLANRRGDQALRDDLLQRLIESCRDARDRYAAQFLQLLRSTLQDGQPLDLTKFDSLQRLDSDYHRLMAQASVVQLLFDTGRTAEATDRLAKLLREPATNLFPYDWAWVQARENGLDPVELRGWPAPANRPVWQPQTPPSDIGPEESPNRGTPAAPQGPPPAPI